MFEIVFGFALVGLAVGCVLQYVVRRISLDDDASGSTHKDSYDFSSDVGE